MLKPFGSITFDIYLEKDATLWCMPNFFYQDRETCKYLAHTRIYFYLLEILDFSQLNVIADILNVWFDDDPGKAVAHLNIALQNWSKMQRCEVRLLGTHSPAAPKCNQIHSQTPHIVEKAVQTWFRDSIREYKPGQGWGSGVGFLDNWTVFGQVEHVKIHKNPPF